MGPPAVVALAGQLPCPVRALRRIRPPRQCRRSPSPKQPASKAIAGQAANGIPLTGAHLRTRRSNHGSFDAIQSQLVPTPTRPDDQTSTTPNLQSCAPPNISKRPPASRNNRRSARALRRDTGSALKVLSSMRLLHSRSRRAARGGCCRRSLTDFLRCASIGLSAPFGIYVLRNLLKIAPERVEESRHPGGYGAHKHRV
jgi:hypothetical protein